MPPMASFWPGYFPGQGWGQLVGAVAVEEACLTKVQGIASMPVDRVNGPEVVRFACRGEVMRFFAIQPEDLVGDEWAEWRRLAPAQRWLESEKLWQTYLALGGSLDPEPDTQSPFFDARAPRPRAAHGRAGVRILRRGRV